MPAATISGISLSNNSSADETTPAGSNVMREFQTAGGVTIPVTTLGQDVTFQHHMQWYNGYRVDPSVSGSALIHRRNVNYDLEFTVEDPLGQGYAVQIDSLLRGYSAAMWTSGASANAVTATGTSLSGRIDTDTADATDTLGAQIPGLTVTAASGTTANSTAPATSDFAEINDSFSTTTFTGTRNFALRFTTVGSTTTNVFLQNNQTGQGSVRYGLANSDTALDPTGQPQPGDAFPDPSLGHFVTVTASFNPIPEPEGTALVLLATALLRCRRRSAA